MIAAQLLAYYFTELKDDQLKKVRDNSFELLQWSFFVRLQFYFYYLTAAWFTPTDTGLQ